MTRNDAGYVMGRENAPEYDIHSAEMKRRRVIEPEVSPRQRLDIETLCAGGVDVMSLRSDERCPECGATSDGVCKYA